MLLQSWILLVKQSTPTIACLLVSLLLGCNEIGIVVEFCLSYLHGIIAKKRVLANPSLDRSTTPTIDDDTLRYTTLLLFQLAQERSKGREEPGVLLVKGLPVNRCGTDIILHTMRARLILHTKQANLIVAKMVDFIGITRVYTFNGYVDIRLTRT